MLISPWPTLIKVESTRGCRSEGFFFFLQCFVVVVFFNEFEGFQSSRTVSNVMSQSNSNCFIILKTSLHSTEELPQF